MEAVFVNVGSNEVKLPPLTVGLSEQLEKAQKAKTVRGGAKAKYEWLQQVIPAKVLSRRLSGSTLDGIDCVALELLFTQVVNAYRAPALNEKAKELNKQVQAIKPVLDVMSRQGFKHVK